MELSQKIETRVLRSADGRTLRLDYSLLSRTEGSGLQISGPYGLEIVLTDQEGVCRVRCRNLTEDYRKAVRLIHVFASNRILPPEMLDRLKRDRNAY